MPFRSLTAHISGVEGIHGYRTYGERTDDSKKTSSRAAPRQRLKFVDTARYLGSMSGRWRQVRGDADQRRRIVRQLAARAIELLISKLYGAGITLGMFVARAVGFRRWRRTAIRVPGTRIRGLCFEPKKTTSVLNRRIRRDGRRAPAGQDHCTGESSGSEHEGIPCWLEMPCFNRDTGAPWAVSVVCRIGKMELAS